MRRISNGMVLAGTTALVVVFAAVLWHLFSLRFSTGDIYPDYSSLNAGPRGTKVLFEALGGTAALDADRNFLPLTRLKNVSATTLVIAGAAGSFFGKDTPEAFEAFEAALADGCDAVVALTPRTPARADRDPGRPIRDPWAYSDEAGAVPDSGEPEGEPAGEPAAPGTDGKTSAGLRWQFSFQRAGEKDDDPAKGWEARFSGGMPGSMALPRWFSAWRFVPDGTKWTTLAEVDGKPVVIRREFGSGSLTLVSDSIFLSNEAMLRSPRPGFLLWLLGRHPRIVFDETHHGTQSSPGVMYLARHYRLLGIFVGAAILLTLFVWRSASTLVPRVDEEPGRDAGLAGLRGGGGLFSLLRQNLPRARLLETCFREWSKSRFADRRHGDADTAAVRRLIEAAPRRSEAAILDTYRAVCDHLRQRF